jgi:hypothetical protein
MRGLAKERTAELVREAVRGGSASRRRRPRAYKAVALGSSLRLRDGRWVHMRHDSA